jgi:hypothetical protein
LAADPDQGDTSQWLPLMMTDRAGGMDGKQLLLFLIPIDKHCYMKRIKPYLLFLSLLIGFFQSRANEGKSDPCLIQGYVMDAVTKKPVSGVIVSASSKGTASSIEAVTDAEGFFKFSQLPASQVNLLFDKKGYQLIRRNGVTINEKATLKINVEFLREADGDDPGDSEYPIIKLLQIN